MSLKWIAGLWRLMHRSRKGQVVLDAHDNVLGGLELSGQWLQLAEKAEQFLSDESITSAVQRNTFKFYCGLAQARLGFFSKALPLLESIYVEDPDYPKINPVLGNVYLMMADAKSAMACYQRAVVEDPHNPVVWVNYSRSCIEGNQLNFAKRAILKALDLEENNFIALRYLATIYSLEGDDLKAEGMLRSLLIAPVDPDVVQVLTGLLQKQERIDAALDVLVQSEQLVGGYREPELSYVLAKLEGIRAYVFQKSGRREEAKESFLQSLALDNSLLETHFNFGLLQVDLGDVNKAAASFEYVLNITPDHNKARWELSLLKLRKAHYQLGWKDYGLRFLVQKDMRREFPVSLWKGEPVGLGELIIVAEQGLGDEIMFGSCLPDLVQEVEEPLIECHPKLAGIYKRSFPNATVIGREQVKDNTWLEQHKNVRYYLPVGELPAKYRGDSHQFPYHSGYLQPDPKKVEHWVSILNSLGGGLKVGISWQGGIQQTRSDIRSIPLMRWKSVLEQTNCHFVSLQYTESFDERRQVEQEYGVKIHHWQEAIDSYEETAALVKALDVVVSVQTALVHLSGAVGAKVYAMISASPEWRYLDEGEVMPWYPSVSLVRQTRLNDWDEVLIGISGKLHKMQKQLNKVG